MPHHQQDGPKAPRVLVVQGLGSRSRRWHRLAGALCMGMHSLLKLKLSLPKLSPWPGRQASWNATTWGHEEHAAMLLGKQGSRLA